MTTSLYRALVLSAYADIKAALLTAEQQLPSPLQRSLYIRKLQKMVNPWETLRWEYESALDSPLDPDVRKLLSDLVQLGTAYYACQIILHEDPHADIPLDELDLKLAKTRRLQ